VWRATPVHSYFPIMVRKKAERQSYALETVVAAWQSVKNNHMSINKAAVEYGIPKSTLKRYMKSFPDSPPEELPKLGTQYSLSSAEELTLLGALLMSVGCGFGINMAGVLSMVSHFLLLSGRVEPGFQMTACWYHAFMKRNPVLSARKQEALSRARALKGKYYIDDYFKKVKWVFGEHEAAGKPFLDSEIYNLDESGKYYLCIILAILQLMFRFSSGFELDGDTGAIRVIARRGTPVVYCSTGCEKPVHITVSRFAYVAHIIILTRFAVIVLGYGMCSG
jgi:hypothetical protein